MNLGPRQFTVKPRARKFLSSGISNGSGTEIAKLGRHDSRASASRMDRRNRNLWLHHLQTQSPDEAIPQLFRSFLRFKRPDSVRVTNLEAFVTLAVFAFQTPIGYWNRFATAAFRRSFSQHLYCQIATPEPVASAWKYVPPFIARTDSPRFASC